MTSTTPGRRFPTFGELDKRLTPAVRLHGDNGWQRGPSGEFVRSGSLGGNLSLSAGRFGKHLSILGSRPGVAGRETLCRVTRLTHGDTLYAVSGASPYGARAGVVAWREAAEMLGLGPSPHGVTPDGTGWFLVSANGMLSDRSFGLQRLPYDWETLPKSTRPKFEEWLACAADVPTARFGTLVADFPLALQRRIREVVEAEVQLLWRRHVRHPIRIEELPLHVVLPPAMFTPSRRLLIDVSLHDRTSRAAFGIDTDYASRNLHVRAREDGDPGAAGMRWKSTEDAIAGIREWAIGSVPIPGPD